MGGRVGQKWPLLFWVQNHESFGFFFDFEPKKVCKTGFERKASGAPKVHATGDCNHKVPLLNACHYCSVALMP